MLKAFSLVLIFIFTAYIMSSGLINTLHNELIFAPTRADLGSPSDIGVNYEDVFIETSDGETLHGYYLPHEEKTKKVILLLHGNGDNATTWYRTCVNLQRNVKANTFVIDYRGYGKSTGKPTPQGAINDALAMHEYILSKGISPKDLSLFGISLGGAISLELGKRKEVNSIILQSTFSSLADIAKDIYPFLPSFIVKKDVFNSLENIKEVNCPILISHGTSDLLINKKHSERLFEAAKEKSTLPRELIILKGAGHNDYENYYDEKFYSSLNKIVN